MSLGRGGLLASEKAQKLKEAIAAGKHVVPNETEPKKRYGQGKNGTLNAKGAIANVISIKSRIRKKK